MLLRTFTQLTKTHKYCSILSKNLFSFSQPFKLDPSKDYYTLLQLPKDADNAQIESSFHRFSLLYHPDINPANLAKYNQLIEARTILTNQKLRKQYDKQRFFYKFTKEVNNRFENQHKQPYESKKTDRYSYELTPQEQEVAWKTKRWIKRGLIVLVGFAIFFPFVFWKGGDGNAAQLDAGVRPSAVYRQQLRNQYSQQNPNSQQQYQQVPYPQSQQYRQAQAQTPNMVVTGQFVTD